MLQKEELAKLKENPQMGLLFYALEIVSPRVRVEELSDYYDFSTAQKIRAKYPWLTELYCDMPVEMAYGIFNFVPTYSAEMLELAGYFSYMRSMPVRNFLVCYTGFDERDINSAFVSMEGRKKLFTGRLQQFGTIKVANLLFTQKNKLLDELYALLTELAGELTGRTQQMPVETNQTAVEAQQTATEPQQAVTETHQMDKGMELYSDGALQMKGAEIRNQEPVKPAERLSTEVTAVSEKEMVREKQPKVKKERKAAVKTVGVSVNKAFVAKEDRNFILPETEYPEALRLMGDKTRFSILRLLKINGEMSGLEIVSTMKLAASTVSHHMSQLAACGLVTERPENVTKYYSVNEAGVKELIRLIEENLI